MKWIAVISIVIAIVILLKKITRDPVKPNKSHPQKNSNNAKPVKVEPRKKWPRSSYSCHHGVYLAYKKNIDRQYFLVGTSYFESSIYTEHIAFAHHETAFSSRPAQVSIFLPETLPTGDSTRKIIDSKYIIMNVVEFPTHRTGSAKADFVFCDNLTPQLFISHDQIVHNLYIPKASIGSKDILIDIYIGPDDHHYETIPLYIRKAADFGCNAIWNESFDSRPISRSIGKAFSYLADMTDEEIERENKEWMLDLLAHSEIEKIEENRLQKQLYYP